MTLEQYREMESTDINSGRTNLTTLVIEENGEISGITQLQVFPCREKFLSQGLTGVPIKYRGRKIGKWIKTTMLKYVKDNYPKAEAIVTDNAETNAPMLYINNKLGFKMYKPMIRAEISLNDLQSYFNSKHIEEITI